LFCSAVWFGGGPRPQEEEYKKKIAYKKLGLRCFDAVL